MYVCLVFPDGIPSGAAAAKTPATSTARHGPYLLVRLRTCLARTSPSTILRVALRSPAPERSSFGLFTLALKSVTGGRQALCLRHKWLRHRLYLCCLLLLLPSAMNDAWATTTCTPLIGNISSYDFEESASPRSDVLLASMQKLVRRQLDGSDFEATAAQEDMSEYATELQNLTLPGFVVAGFIVVSLLPLWVSRCCAHR